MIREIRSARAGAAWHGAHLQFAARSAARV